MMEQDDPKYIPIGKVPDVVESLCGRRFDRKTIYRWRHRGAYGVTLRCFKIGARWYTTRQALEEFFEASTRAYESQETADEFDRAQAKYDRRRASINRRLAAEGMADD